MDIVIVATGRPSTVKVTDLKDTAVVIDVGVNRIADTSERGWHLEGDFDKTVTINWIDSVRTKDIVPSLGDLDDKEYGTDPIEIIGNWVTIVEDGYLTLSFCALWGNPSVAHSINLVSGVDPENPYVLELRHNAMGDNYHINPTYGNGVIAFDLSSLPSTEGKEVDLVINYKGLNISNASVKFKYCTGEAAQTGRQPSFAKLTKSLEIK